MAHGMAHVHREFTEKFELTNLCRDNLSLHARGPSAHRVSMARRKDGHHGDLHQVLPRSSLGPCFGRVNEGLLQAFVTWNVYSNVRDVTSIFLTKHLTGDSAIVTTV